MYKCWDSGCVIVCEWVGMSANWANQLGENAVAAAETRTMLTQKIMMMEYERIQISD